MLMKDMPGIAVELRIPTDKLVKINDQLGLHPACKSLGSLLDDGRLAIAQGVGYPNPNRSHDVSMAIWQTARMDPIEHESFGWIGGALDEKLRQQVAITSNDAGGRSISGRWRFAAAKIVVRRDRSIDGLCNSSPGVFPTRKNLRPTR